MLLTKLFTENFILWIIASLSECCWWIGKMKLKLKTFISKIMRKAKLSSETKALSLLFQLNPTISWTLPPPSQPAIKWGSFYLFYPLFSYIKARHKIVSTIMHIILNQIFSFHFIITSKICAADRYWRFCMIHSIHKEIAERRIDTMLYEDAGKMIKDQFP